MSGEGEASSCCSCFGGPKEDAYHTISSEGNNSARGAVPHNNLPGGGSFSSTSSGNVTARGKKSRKIVFLGFRAVGKTVVNMVHVGETFEDRYHPTIQNTFQKVITFNGDEYSAEIIDPAGMDESSLLPTQYSLGVHGYVLIYSVASKASFDKISVINDKLMHNFLGSSNVPRVLVGNKTDMKKERQVTTEEGQALADSWGCPFVECSAKKNENVVEIFRKLMSEIDQVDRATGLGDDSGSKCSII
uniref:Rheb1 n=1 Tax=Eukaryota sp. TaxID=1928008 RepID=A0A2R4IKX9_9EUKA|nr:Rheb1 [Eukaryota sp.]